MIADFLAAAAAAGGGDGVTDCGTMFPRPAAETIKRADTCCCAGIEASSVAAATSLPLFSRPRRAS